MNTKSVVALLDLIIWAIALWLILAPKDSNTQARIYWYLSRSCQTCAAWFGQLAIETELAYYAKVKQ